MESCDTKFKDLKPEETYIFLKSIIDSQGIVLEENWQPMSDIGTFALRINLKGAKGVGANGKGTTKEFARASAYAEFFERLQNMKLSPISQLLLAKKKDDGFYFFNNEVVLSNEELVQEDNSFIRTLFRKNGIVERNLQGKLKLLDELQINEFVFTGEINRHICIPFYSLKEKRIVHLPYMMYSNLYGSNGMCAGNSPAEALVQGFSEIYERNANSRVLRDKISLPDIPIDFIKRFPDIYAMYNKIEQNSKYRVLLKDASMGFDFPIACLIVINLEKSTCGVKFGAHPDWRIAIERSFTESVQGNNIEKFSLKSRISFLNENVDDVSNFVNSYRTSDAMYPYQLLGSESIFPLNNNSVLGENNLEFLTTISNNLLNKHYDILIHDCSYYGFPSYHIIIPDFSEIGDFSFISGFAKRYQCQKLVTEPQKISLENADILVSDLKSARNKVLENTLYYYGGVYSTYDYIGSEINVDLSVFSAIIALKTKNYTLIKSILGGINEFIITNQLAISDRLRSVLKYLEGVCVFQSHLKTMSFINKIFSEELVQFLQVNFSNHDDVLTKLYPNLIEQGKFCNELFNYIDLIRKFKAYQLSHPINKDGMKTLNEIFRNVEVK